MWCKGKKINRVYNKAKNLNTFLYKNRSDWGPGSSLSAALVFNEPNFWNIEYDNAEFYAPNMLLIYFKNAAETSAPFYRIEFSKADGMILGTGINGTFFYGPQNIAPTTAGTTAWEAWSSALSTLGTADMKNCTFYIYQGALS